MSFIVVDYSCFLFDMVMSISMVASSYYLWWYGLVGSYENQLCVGVVKLWLVFMPWKCTSFTTPKEFLKNPWTWHFGRWSCLMINAIHLCSCWWCWLWMLKTWFVLMENLIKWSHWSSYNNNCYQTVISVFLSTAANFVVIFMLLMKLWSV